MSAEGRLTAALTAALAVAGAGAAADRLARLTPLAAAVVAGLGVLPLIAALAAAVRHGNEFWRRLQLVALAVAVGAAAVVMLVAPALARAGLLRGWRPDAAFPVMAVAYLVGLALATWHYR